MTELFKVFADIDRDFKAITEADVARVQWDMADVEPTVRVLGTLHDVNLHKLWALAHHYDGRTIESAMHSKFKAESVAAGKETAVLALYYDTLASLVRNLFWISAKTDIGEEAWHAEQISLRSGWIMVSVPGGNPLGMLAKMLRERGQGGGNDGEK